MRLTPTQTDPLPPLSPENWELVLQLVEKVGYADPYRYPYFRFVTFPKEAEGHATQV